MKVSSTTSAICLSSGSSLCKLHPRIETRRINWVYRFVAKYLRFPHSRMDDFSKNMSLRMVLCIKSHFFTRESKESASKCNSGGSWFTSSGTRADRGHELTDVLPLHGLLSMCNKHCVFQLNELRHFFSWAGIHQRSTQGKQGRPRYKRYVMGEFLSVPTLWCMPALKNISHKLIHNITCCFCFFFSLLEHFVEHLTTAYPVLDQNASSSSFKVKG